MAKKSKKVGRVRTSKEKPFNNLAWLSELGSIVPANIFDRFNKGSNALLKKLNKNLQKGLQAPNLKALLGGLGGNLLPAMEVFEDANRYIARVELPGISKDNITIEVNDHTLTIKGERRANLDELKREHYRSEFHYGTYLRTIVLPAESVVDKIEAQMNDGVLEVSIPLVEKVTQPKRVTINTKDGQPDKPMVKTAKVVGG